MKALALFTGFVLFAGLIAVTFAASPLVILLGKFAIAVSLIALAAGATTYVMSQAFAAHVLRTEDFHWN